MSGNRVLVIDDEKNMRHMLQIMLKKAGYAAETASNGAEGLEKMSKAEFDFILCDLRMPKMDGMTFLKRAHEKYPDKTFIMMSAFGNMDDALEAMKIGAYDYISKPFKTDEVLLTLKKAEERERLMADHGFSMKAAQLESTRRSIGRAEGEALVPRLKMLLERFDHVIVQKPGGGVERVIILGEKAAAAPPAPEAAQAEPAEGDTAPAAEIVVESQRKGTSHALNLSLEIEDVG